MPAPVAHTLRFALVGACAAVLFAVLCAPPGHAAVEYDLLALRSEWGVAGPVGWGGEGATWSRPAGSRCGGHYAQALGSACMHVAGAERRECCHCIKPPCCVATRVCPLSPHNHVCGVAALSRAAAAAARLPPAAVRAGSWGPSVCAQRGVSCQRDALGAFDVYEVVPTNMEKEDPGQLVGDDPSVCPGPPFDVGAIAPADQAALNCIFAELEALGGWQPRARRAARCRRGRGAPPPSPAPARLPLPCRSPAAPAVLRRQQRGAVAEQLANQRHLQRHGHRPVLWVDGRGLQSL